MEAAAVGEKTWPEPGHGNLRKGKTGALVFPLAECLGCQQTDKSEDQLVEPGSPIGQRVDSQH
jgi:hypothetical protein